MTDTILKRKGLDVLTETFGLVDAERFISLIIQEPFNYTDWQQNLYNNISLDEFYHNVKNYRKKNKEQVMVNN